MGSHKVEICHNENTLDVGANAVPAHLAHGDFVGPCTQANPIALKLYKLVAIRGDETCPGCCVIEETTSIDGMEVTFDYCEGEFEPITCTTVPGGACYTFELKVIGTDCLDIEVPVATLEIDDDGMPIDLVPSTMETEVNNEITITLTTMFGECTFN